MNCEDPSMATPPLTNRGRLPLKENLKQQKWLTLLGLPVLLASSLSGVYSLWGVLSVYWGITSLRSGEAYLLETIERATDPVLFWIISGMWITFGALYLVADFYPELWLY